MKRAAVSFALGLSLLAVGQPAFAQDATPPTTPTTPSAPSTAAPTDAPADPNAQTPPSDNAASASGGITLGTGAPKKDTAAPAKKEEKAPKPRPFAGTQLFTQAAMSTTAVFRNQQQEPNTTADLSFFFLPRYSISKDWQLRGRATFTYEFTNSDTTQTKNEPRFGDTALQLFYRGIPAFAGIKPQVALGVTAPTSPESRARTMVLSPALTVQLAKSFENVGGGEIDIIATGTYSHPFYTKTTGGIRGDFPYQRSCWGAGSSCEDQLGGGANASDIVSWTAIVAGSWGKFSPAFLFNMSHQFLYTFSAENDVNPQTGITASRLSNPNTVRNGSYFSFWLDYEANSWLTPEIGYYMSRSLMRADGTYGNPFFDRYQDMRVYLGANINLDNLEKAIEGGDAEGGVVRAKNRRGPALGAY